MNTSEKMRFPNVSRRHFLQGAAAAAITTNAGHAGALNFGASRQFAYVGTYTGGDGNGQGIYLYEVDPVSGDLTLIKLAAAITSPSFVLASSSGKYLYANNEVSNFEGSNGSINAFAVNRKTGDLTLINTVSSAGAGPVYMSFDATGRFMFVANYGDGSISVLPVASNGSLGNAVDSHIDTGNVGPGTATNAPPGSFAFSGHDAPHAHCILPSRNNKFVVQTDLGQDRVYIYQLSAASGKLTPADTPFISIPPGDGPRHLAFHPFRPWLYSIQEEASTIMLFSLDESSGELTQRQIISALPPGFAGSSFGSEVAVSADGRFLYAANRLEDSLTVFGIESNGELKYLSQAATHGDYPRQFAIDPSGNYLYSCNQRSDNVTGYRIDRYDGALHFIGRFTGVGTPSCIAFLP